MPWLDWLFDVTAVWLDGLKKLARSYFLVLALWEFEELVDLLLGVDTWLGVDLRLVVEPPLNVDLFLGVDLSLGVDGWWALEKFCGGFALFTDVEFPAISRLFQLHTYSRDGTEKVAWSSNFFAGRSDKRGQRASLDF